MIHCSKQYYCGQTGAFGLSSKRAALPQRPQRKQVRCEKHVINVAHTGLPQICRERFCQRSYLHAPSHVACSGSRVPGCRPSVERRSC